MKKFIPVLVAVAVLLTACGPQGTPTLAPAEVEGTAVAAAWTMVAMTQLAIPTATPLPPTETPSPTPLPTFTPLPLPTLELVTPTATISGSGNCNGPINMGEAGPTSRVRIENNTGGNINISLNLMESAFGQCGAISYSLAKNDKQIVNLPRGTWWAYAWVTSGGSNSTASCTFTIRPADYDLLRLVVDKESCQMIGA
ncbi:MAG: hypothetical protein ACYC6R_14525 [Anaerolineales bacterium]